VDGEISEGVFNNVIGKAHLYYDELHTAIIEVEAVINSSPLSYISSDDIEEPLSPHLLTGRRLLRLPDKLCYSSNEYENFNITQELINKRLRYLN
jgi:hypothetical protein